MITNTTNADKFHILPVVNTSISTTINQTQRSKNTDEGSN